MLFVLGEQHVISKFVLQAVELYCRSHLSVGQDYK